MDVRQMFAKLYSNCLEKVTVQCNFKKHESENTSENSEQLQLMTLGEMVRSCNYVLFYIINSRTPPNAVFLRALRQFLSSRNENIIAKDVPKRNSLTISNSPAKLKRLFSFGKNSSAKKSGSISSVAIAADVNVLVVDIEFTPDEANLNFISDLSLYFTPSQAYLSKSRLLRALNFSNAPSLFLLDCSNLNIVSQAYRSLLDDCEGKNFPWTISLPPEIFAGYLLRNTSAGQQERIEIGSLGKGIKGLFFGAKWCPPSREMGKQLAQIYSRLKAKHPSFEIVYCSSDTSEESFNEHFSTMPWLAFPYGSKRLTQLTRAYDVCGIPALIILDEDFSVITRNGRNMLLSDPNYTLRSTEPIYELTELTAYRISELPSLILFTEGSPEDTQFSIQILSNAAEWIHSASEVCLKNPAIDTESVGKGNITPPDEKNTRIFADLLQIFYTGEDPICDYILESLGQDQAELPLLLICDVQAGYMTISEKPEVSDQVLYEFVADYRAGRANVLPIPYPRPIQGRSVAGIPAEMFEHLIPKKDQSAGVSQSV